MPGPIPKRADQRAGHTHGPKSAEEVERLVVASGPVEPPPLGFEPRHAITVDLYRSALDSAQSRYFEPTDWHVLRLLLLQVDAYVGSLLGSSARPSASQLEALLRGFSSLMFTEGDRRRLRVEIKRTADASSQTDAGVTALAEYRAALGLT